MDFMGIKEGSLLYRKQIIFLSSHDRSTLMVQQRIINQLRAGIKNVWHSAESESSFKSRICLTDVPDTSLAPNTFQPSRDTFRNEPSTPSLYLSYKLFAQDLILTARMEALHIVFLLHLTSHVDYQKLNKILKQLFLPNISKWLHHFKWIEWYRVQKSGNQTLEVWSVRVSERWSVNHAQHNISHHRIRRHCVNRTRLSRSGSYSSRDTSHLISPSTPVLWPWHGLVLEKFVLNLQSNGLFLSPYPSFLCLPINLMRYKDFMPVAMSLRLAYTHHVGWECPDILSLYHCNPDLTFAPCPSWYPSAAKMSTWQIDKHESIFQIKSKPES